jgi:hypothetical protein
MRCVTVLVAAGAGRSADPWQVTALPNQACRPPAELGSFPADRRLASLTGLTAGQQRAATVTIYARGSGTSTTAWVLLLLVAALVGAVAIRFVAPVSRRIKRTIHIGTKDG